MNKTLTEEAIKLTQKMLERYWKHDYQYALDMMMDNAVWIGSTQEQFMCGIKKIKEDFESVDKQIKSCHLSNQQFMLVHNSGNSCSVAGKYLVATDPDTDVFLQVQQRCLVIWTLKDKRLWIEGIHVSNPLGELKLENDEQFPNALGKQALKYLNDNIKSNKERKKIMISDKDKLIHFVYTDEIEVIEADKHSCIIYLQKEVIHANIALNVFLKEMGNLMLLIHRSYAINPNYVNSILERDVIMENGKVITISEKNIAGVKKSIRDYLEH